MPTPVSFRLAGGAQPLIVLPAAVDGQPPGPFVLDTGAGPCLLTPAAAARWGVRAAGRRIGSGAAGTVEVLLSPGHTLAVGGARREGLELAITPDVDRIGTVIGAGLAGIVGQSFLSHYVVTLDYAALRLHLAGAEEGSSATEAPLAEVPFGLAAPDKPLVLVDFALGSGRSYRFAVDTGASTTVVSTEVAGEEGIGGEPVPDLTAGGGMVQATAGVARGVRLGPVRVNQLAVVAVDFLPRLSQLTGAPIDGILGHNFLRRFRVQLDYPGARLRLFAPSVSPSGRAGAIIGGI